MHGPSEQGPMVEVPSMSGGRAVEVLYVANQKDLTVSHYGNVNVSGIRVCY